ncbi:nucleotidyltransferase substrate binding protein [Candidatus Poribacteria bacterium]|nr:nucleotidyltransferase substrate binding protein [Candidatus Poribacteria bacterium]
MALDLSSLKRAIEALDDSINSYISNKNNETLSSKDIDTIKSGVIQNFEVAYELCWKFMKRWIDEQVSPEIAEGVPRRELYRISAENKLILDVDEWMYYHKSRNLTSHTYDKNNAEMAFEAAIKFIHDAKTFFKTLEDKND